MALDILDGNLYDFGINDLKDMWNSEELDTNVADMDRESEWTSPLENNSIILHDRMMTDAVQAPNAQVDHCYSLSVDVSLPESSLGFQTDHKMEEFDMVLECFPGIPMTSATEETEFSGITTVKQEPLSSPPSPSSYVPCYVSSDESSPTSKPQQQDLLEYPLTVFTTRFENSTAGVKCQPVGKTDKNQDFIESSLPLTPLSNNSSDSDDSLSPLHCLSNPSSPPSLVVIKSQGFSSQTNSCHSSPFVVMQSSFKGSISSQLISKQPKGGTGSIVLTEEEKRTLLSEGYTVPQHLPLTKAEEKSLKKIRRKIKNKISAQESRRKKKEYVDNLEKSVENLTHENDDYKKRLESLKISNKSLLSQLQKLQSLFRNDIFKNYTAVATQTFQVVQPLNNSPVENYIDPLENNTVKTR
ncbi:cyclic AMP-responsive element-binding protein 3-like protein 1 isoform X2 [Limulus polyphemus]|uniref:Cyclic AMP-responsive element-binding protein 3-like protein 1 isoform X2 n=1 Tax=Limulus polyphemus TaxID=6850 RepID=A0ABM1SH26_LIMPO|nr:cyclic AMP-responsive element-binding protein 3-like protein 1 isoform X2 [Limulus polyphemus]